MWSVNPTTGEITFTPEGTFFGSPTPISYTVKDITGNTSNEALVTLTALNNPPVAVNDTNSAIPVNAVSAPLNPLVATDVDGTVISYIIKSLPLHGTLDSAGFPIVLGQVFSAFEISNIGFTPDGLFVGDDSFTFTAVDDDLAEDLTPATVLIPITNTPPVAIDDTNAPIASTAGASPIDPLAATDTDGTVVSYTISSLPTNGTLALAGTPVTVGQVLTPAEAAALTYDPSGTFVGTDSFTFTATDNNGGEDTTPATVSIPVGNNPPVAIDDTNAAIASTAGASPIDALAATDTDGTVVSYTISSLPTNGTLALAGTPVTVGQVLTPAEAAALTYDPSGTFVGTDSFTFTATDNNGGVDTTPATVSIPVGNTPPVATDDTNAPIASTAGASPIDPLAATDVDGTIVSYTISSLPTNGTLALAGTPVTVGQVLTPAEAAALTYDPSGTFVGTDSFTFTATDNNGGVDTTPATVSIPVGNNPPVATDDTNAPIASTAGASPIDPLAATDTDGTVVSYTISSLPTNGTLALAGTPVTVGQVLTPAEAAALTYDPSGTFVGTDSFTFTATDNNGGEDTTPATVSIPVGNNPPVAIDDTNAPIASTAGASPIDALAATDTDGTVVSYTISSLPTNGTLALAGTPVTVGQVLTPAEAAALTYDPSGTFVGTDSFTFTATDNNGGEDTTPATVSIPVGNNPPAATDDTNAPIASTAGASPIDPLAATDTDGTIVSYTISSLPTNGTLALAGTPVTVGQVLTPAEAAALTYDPSGTFVGTDSFTFTATDNNGGEDTTPATVSIPVGNNPPVATDDTNAPIASTAGASPIDPLAATDTDGTIVNYTISSLPTNGTLALAGTPVTVGQVLTPAEAAALTYDPSGTFVGTDSFTFTATDNNGSADTTPATVSIPVGNNPPVATDDTNAPIASTAGASPIDPLAATDTDGTVVSYTISSLPTNGTLALAGTPVTVGQVLTPAEAAALTYDPSGTFVGTDSFTFTATDNNGGEDTTPATVSIPVGNNPPVATDDTNLLIASTAGASPIDPLAATDTDGTVVSYTISSLPTNGTLALAGTPVTVGQVLTPAEAAALTYDPSGTFVGTDSFTFTATDNNGGVDTTPATVSIPVGNTPPVATDDTNAPIASTAGASTIDALAATDTDGTVVSYTISSLPTNGTLALAGTPVTVGQVLTPAEAAALTYDPSGTFVGTDSFTFTATDNNGGEDTTPATVSIPVGNNPPVATDDTNLLIASTAGASPIDPLAATDVDGTIVSYTISTLPTNGTLALAGTPVTVGQVLTPAEAAALTYDPSGTFVGTDSFTFTATDNNGSADTTPATVSIPVGNTPPVATDDTNAPIASTAGASPIDPLAATDVDGTIVSYTISSLPTNGTLALAGTPVTVGQVLTPAEAAALTYDPSGTFVGTDSFTFTATDNNGSADTTPATVSIPVGNTPPVATDDTIAPIASTAGASPIDPLAATDTDGTVVSYTISSLPTNGTLALAGTPVTVGQVLTPAEAAALTYDPSGTFVGTDSFTFTATDNNGSADTTPATVSIPVGNNPPVATDDTNAPIASTAGASPIDPLAATDTDGTIVSYTISSLPTNGVLALAGTPVTVGQVLTPAEAAALTYDPSGTFVGTDSFTFTATDNNGSADTTPATVGIPVGNNPPVAIDDTIAPIASTAGASPIDPLAATDVDGTIVSYTISSLPTNGTLALAGTPVTVGQVLTPAEAAALTYDPSGTFVGTDSFTFTATDNNGAVDTTPATVSIPVGNNPPVATDDTNAPIASTAGASPIDPLAATDVDGTIVSYTISSLPTNGTLALAGTPVTVGQVLTPAEAAALTYDPSGTFVGTDSFTFTATDNNGGVDTTPATVSIPVGNNPPVATDDTVAPIASTAGASPIDPLAATDTDGTVVSYAISSLPTNGTLALAGTPVTVGQVLTPAEAAALTYDPSGTFVGTDSFTFTATDNNGSADTTPATVSIPVGNNPPVAIDDTIAPIASTAGASPIDPLAATDVDGTIVSYTISSLPTNGTLALAGTPVTVGQVLTPAEAAALTYDPSGTFVGTDSFTFTATDNNGSADTTPATVSIPVGNNPPVAIDDTNAPIASTAGASPIDPLAATDTDGTVVSYTISSLPTNGTLALAGTPVTVGQVLTPAEAAALTYDPSGTFVGTDSFTFTATDNNGSADTTPATVSIPVGNNPPVATDDTNAPIASTAGASPIDPLAATDTDGTVVSYAISSLPTNGTLALAGTPVTVGQVLTPAEAAALTYDPSGTFVGTDSFTFTATDNNGSADTTPATVSIPVGNNPPVAIDDTIAPIASTAGASPIDPLAATDVDGTIVSYTISSLPTNGTLALAGTPVTVGQVLTPAEAAALTYDPSGTFVGTDSFTFTATDNNGSADTTPATVSIPVGNNPPVATDDTNAPIASTAGASPIDPLAATDTDGTVVSYTISSLPTNGVLALAGTPVTVGQVLTPAEAAALTYDPSGTFVGTDSFTFTATDNNGSADTTPATVSIPVGNNPPVAIDDTIAPIASTAGASPIDPLAATDTDGTVVSYTISSLPTNGTLALAGTPVTVGQILTPAEAAALTYDPSGTFVGTDSFTFTATDNNGSADTTPATVSIPVGNNPPVAIDDTIAPIASTAGASPIDPLAATDTDGTIVSYTISSLPTNGTLALAGTPVTVGQVLTPAEASALTYDPSGTFFGTDSFTFTATDNSGATDASPATVSLPINGISPLAIDDADLGNAIGSNGSVFILANDTLSNGNLATISNATVDLNPATPAIESTLSVVGEGVFNFNTTSGELTFVPAVGFMGNPTPINYILVENLTGLKDTASVVITYVGFPNAVNDEDLNNLPGIVGVVNALVNDTLSTGAIATFSTANVDLTPLTPSVDYTLNVSGEGVYTYNPANGIVSFTPEVSFFGNPTPINYKVIENATGFTDIATITMTYLMPIVAVNDTSLANLPGSIANLNIVSNDTLSSGTPATPTDVVVDLDLSTVGDQQTLAVSGEGTWTYNSTSGILSFAPEVGFIGNPTSINYILTEALTGLVDTAQVTVEYSELPPIAVNDSDLDNVYGTNGEVNVLLNDDLSDGSPATVSTVTVDLNPATPAIDASLTVAGQGTYTYNAGSGLVTFVPVVGLAVNPTPISYILTELSTGLKDTASITITYIIPLEPVNDQSSNNVPGVNAIVNIILNDTLADGSPATPSEVIVDLNPSTPGVETTLVVSGEGTWTYNPTNGQLEFDPENGFTGNPTPIVYELTEIASGQSRNASVTVEYIPAVPIEAINDSSINNVPGVNAVLNIIANDTLNDGSVPTPIEVLVDLDSTQTGVQTTLTVSGQGVWSYNNTTGQITFNPQPGFTTDPTDIKYVITEIATGLSDTALINVEYTEIAPIANSNSDLINEPQVPTAISLLPNDLLSDMSQATPTTVDVDLEPTVAGIQTTLLVVGEGIYVYNPTNGVLTFTPAVGNYSNPTPIVYGLVEKLTGLSDTAMVTIQYQFTPMLELIKVGTLMGTGLVGDSIRYDFTILNTGNVPVTGISITDTKISPNPIAVTPSALAPGGTGVASRMYYLTPADITAGEVLNSATVNGLASNGVAVRDTSDNGDPGMPGGSNVTRLSLPSSTDVDVKLTGTILGNCERAIGDIITYQVKVFREDTLGNGTVDVVVADSLSSNFELVSQIASEGSFNVGTSKWSGISLAAGDTATLTFQLRVLTNMGGLSCVESWIDSLSRNDVDSNPGDRVTTEDDIARACISVPMSICPSNSESAELSTSLGYTSYQWYRNGALISGATTATYTANTAGSYTVIVNGGTCPNGSCCPIIVQENCPCPVEICLPISIRKTR